MNYKEKLQRLRQAGLFTKGAIYCLLGGLTAMAAIGAGGDINGREGVMQFLLELPLGKVLVVVVATGLTAYSLWRFYEAYNDPKSDNGETRWGAKVRYVYSGILYGFLAYSFARAFFGSSSSDGESKRWFLQGCWKLPGDNGLLVLLRSWWLARRFISFTADIRESLCENWMTIPMRQLPTN